MKPQNAVACLMYNEDRTQVCLIKRRDVPVWVLPGGGIEDNETPEEAAARETTEELGAPCHIKRLVGVYFPRNRLSRKTFLYEMQTHNPILDKSTEETLGAQFFPLTDLPDMPPPYKSWILDGIEIPQGAVCYSYIKGVHWGNFVKLLLCHPILVLRFILSRLGWHWNS